VVGETSGGGNVIAYNYVDEAIIGSLTNTWQETAINMSHGSFCTRISSRATTPPTWAWTRRTQQRPGRHLPQTGPPGRTLRPHQHLPAAIYVDGWNREMTSIGNVLGSPSFSPTYQILSPATGVNPCTGASPASTCSARTPGSSARAASPAPTTWTTASGGPLLPAPGLRLQDQRPVREPLEPRDRPPDSLYLTQKPAFFGSFPWPWVDPAGATKSRRPRRRPATTPMGPSSTYALTVTKAGSGHRHLVSRRHQLRRRLQRELQLRPPPSPSRPSPPPAPRSQAGAAPAPAPAPARSP